LPYLDFILTRSVVIGSNKQQVTVILDTGSPLLWVNPNCANSGAPATCASIGRYNPETSQTAVKLTTPFNITYGLGSASGTYYTDQIAAGNASDPNMQFGIATTSTYIPYGILGLSPKSSKFSDVPFVYKLASSGTIRSAAFSLDLRSINDPIGKFQIEHGIFHWLISCRFNNFWWH
jgi:candidapepsin